MKKKTTNEMKYKTPNDRRDAHGEWCLNHDCEKPNVGKCLDCFANWLTLEDDEK